MPRVYIKTRNGEEREITGPATGVLMEMLRANGVDGIEGQCGGSCSCATCHIHVDAKTAGRLPPMTDDEKLLVSGLLSFAPQSRLSCQIPVTEGLDGLRLTIPSEG